MEDSYYDAPHLRHLYVFKFTFDTPTGVADLYSIGHTYMDPSILLLDMIASFNAARNYCPRAEILVTDRVADYDNIILDLKLAMYKSHYSFIGLSFTGSDTFYYTNPIDSYRALVPDKTGLIYEPFLPMEMMSSEELAHARSIAIAIDDTGYVYRQT